MKQTFLFYFISSWNCLPLSSLKYYKRNRAYRSLIIIFTAISTIINLLLCSATTRVLSILYHQKRMITASKFRIEIIDSLRTLRVEFQCVNITKYIMVLSMISIEKDYCESVIVVESGACTENRKNKIGYNIGNDKYSINTR